MSIDDQNEEFDEPVGSGDHDGAESDDGEDFAPLGSDDGAFDDLPTTPAPEAPPTPDAVEAVEAGSGESGEAVEAPVEEENPKFAWYVVQTYSGFENRVKLSLEERVKSLGMQKFFGRVIVPHETVEEIGKSGQKKTSTKKFFPGYILVQLELTDDTWHLVKETPKVAGFIGDSRNPAPLSQEEVQALLQQMEGGAKRPRPRVQFEQGDAVKVIDGPFAEFNGTVDDVKPDKGKLRVLISIFGRNTPVELDFVQVEKV